MKTKTVVIQTSREAIAAARDFMASVIEDIGAKDEHLGPGGVKEHKGAIRALSKAGAALRLSPGEAESLRYWLKLHNEDNGKHASPVLRSLLISLSIA